MTAPPLDNTISTPPPAAGEDPHFTVNQLALRFHVDPMTVRRWIKAGRLVALHLGNRCVRIPAAEVARFEEARRA